jgi:glutaminyl-tRNA synthetase
VRLRYGYIVKCLGAEHDAQGNVVAVHCTYDPDTRSGTPGAERRKVKGNIHWLAAHSARPAEVRLYDRLFVVPQPGRAAQPNEAGASSGASARATGAGAGDTIFDDDVPFDEATERNYLDDLNPQARKTARAYIEPALASAPREARYQFERHGYFIADANDHDPSRPVFNRAVTLRDSWGREASSKRA